MSAHRLIAGLLLAFVLLIATDTSATSPNLIVPDWDFAHTARETSVSVMRSLRTTTIDDGDNIEDRAGLSVPVSKKVKIFFSSSKITPDRLQKWLDEGKSADTVFSRMRLNKANGMLLYYEDFTQWLKYVDAFNAKNPTKGTSAIATLTAQYGDAALYKLVEEATMTTRTKELATKLKREQVKHWIAAAKDPDDVFRFKGLDKINENILSNPEFTAWAKYVDDFGAKYPEKQASMVPALLEIYDDATLFRMADAAMRVEGTKSIATKLQDQLTQVWLNSRKSPDNALVDLGLAHTLNNLLERPLFSTWFKYANAFSMEYPQERSTGIEVLSRRFGDDEVARMLGTAKSGDATRSIATILESAQLEMWFRSGKSVDDIRELMRLYHLGDFTGNPLLKTWVSYMNVFLKHNPDKVTSMLTKLETHFTDRPFHQILLAAMKFPSMESAANKLQAEKIQGYLARNQSPQKIFKWLDLDNVGDHLLSAPLFVKWMKYVKAFNIKNPKHQESWFAPIRVNYNPSPVRRMVEVAMNNPNTVKFAEMLEREQFKNMVDNKDLPKNVFHFLGLERTREKTLASSNFQTWVKYLNDFNHRYPADETTMIDGLRVNYNDINLLTIFNAAKKDPKTEKLAINLEGALVNKWVTEKEPMATLKRRFDHMPFADELLKRYANKLKTQPGIAS